MMKKDQDREKYQYRTEKDEEAEKLFKEDKFEKWVHREIFDIFLKNPYESLLNIEKSSRRDTEDSSESFFESPERRCLEEQVIKLMKLQPRGKGESLTGFEDDGKKWSLVRMTRDWRATRKPPNPESPVIKILQTTFRDSVTRFQQSVNREDSSSSSRECDLLGESKGKVVCLGIKLTRALIKVSLLDLHTSQRKKQLGLKDWILMRSCEKQSAVMYLMDYLLNKAEYFADFKEQKDSDDLSEKSVPEENRISDDLLKSIAHAICGIQLLAMNLSLYSGSLDRATKELSLELERCVKHVRKVEIAIDDLMKQKPLRLKPFEEKKRYLRVETNKIFWEELEAEMNKCWGKSFWKYVETTTRLKSVITSHHVVYALCLKFELRV